MIRCPLTGTLILSASDLTDLLACMHLSAQRRAIALGQRGRPRPHESPHADLVRRRGREHEAVQLGLLSAAAAGDVVDLTPADGAWPRTVPDLRREAGRTARAMRAGTRLIYQGTLFDGRWMGRVDFLRRIERPSGLGEHSYEVIDTKLARHARPSLVHQLCLYSRLVGQVQGVPPGHARVIPGDGSERCIPVTGFAALHRRAARRLEAAAAHRVPDVYPEPTGHCDVCMFEAECAARRRADDHLSLVAGARADARARLTKAGIPTLASLATAPDGRVVPDLAPERVSLLHHQARLQLNARSGLTPVRRHLPPAPARGYAGLPAPSEGDVFFDLEGDPYLTADGGIEYLWGWSTAEGYDCRWAHDRPQEKAALEEFVAVVEERRRRHPGLHVFHYAPHERSKLASLALAYATCEAVIDDWLRSGVLVDLYAIVRQALQVGEESYSLKALERHHGFVRLQTSVREGGGSIVAYEAWLATGDAGILHAIRDYNREDCESTASLYAWLVGSMRPEAEQALGVDFGDLPGEPAGVHPPPAWLAEVEDIVGRLHAGLPDDPSGDDPAQAERRLLGHLLLHHYRESKPEWWGWFDLAAQSAEDLVQATDAVGLLTLDRGVAPAPVKRSYDWTYRFPEQEVRLETGDVVDPATGGTHTLVRLEDDHLVLRRAKEKPAPEPDALIKRKPIDARVQRDAIRGVAEAVAAGQDRFAAARAILRREPPRLTSGRLSPDPGDLVDAALGLDRSYLPVQGPPGTGKTHAGARIVVAALRAGRRVAVAAFSHAAIQNMLRAVEHRAHREGVHVRGAYRGSGYESPHGLVEEAANPATCDPDLNLVAGTPWLLARDDHVEAFDLLVVDEAGQMSLASAVAIGRCARDIVLLGDPRQLPQVNRATHPGGSGASALGHVLGEDDVIAPGRGVLLDVSWRMHPDVCAFVSEHSYRGRLRSRPGCARRRVDAPGPLSGAGLRVVEVGHEGRGQDSPEEADAVATLCAGLLGGASTVSDETGATRPLTAGDILVVAPYNLAVRRIRARVPPGVRVGTVDRFQGQEAPVVLFAMTSSSGDDVPRGLDFVFDRNRLNVAVSRAQCLAVLVHSPRLLDADCRTLAQMELVDGACRFAEMALAVVPPPPGRPG